MRRARPWLLPLVPLYAAGLAAKSRLMAERRLRGQVVSVGSLSAGGAGKTPLVMLIVEMLQAAGCGVDVLSRGYGRSGKGVERVDPAGVASRFGDEPMLLARRLGVPVWVGADRYAAGMVAEAGGEGLVHVLDDGFQHRRLARDVDVVLLTLQDVQDGLLPAGNLREPPRALGRAGVIVLREEEAGELRRYVPGGKIVWVVRRTLVFDLSGPSQVVLSQAVPSRAVPSRVFAFCGIARPESFFAMLADAGHSPVGSITFPDHHAFGMRDITRLVAAARSAEAGGFVSTAKDAVKLTTAMRKRLEEIGPLVAAELRVTLLEGGVGDLGVRCEGGGG